MDPADQTTSDFVTLVLSGVPPRISMVCHAKHRFSGCRVVDEWKQDSFNANIIELPFPRFRKLAACLERSLGARPFTQVQIISKFVWDTSVTKAPYEGS